MTNITRIRARKNGDRTVILALVKHPMETMKAEHAPGNATGPARFIEKMTFLLNGQVVAVADLGPNVDANPLTGISVSGATSGDTVSVAWTDSGGSSGAAETTVD
ncbi:MAG: thiosulfate oxidation carrier complex protein SoxZ [Gammaproteobacteria bacterium]